jgi:hypothetical protein
MQAAPGPSTASPVGRQSPAAQTTNFLHDEFLPAAAQSGLDVKQA